MKSCPRSPKRAGKLLANATAARIESIENAISANVTDQTVPQKLWPVGTAPAVVDRSGQDGRVLTFEGHEEYVSLNLRGVTRKENKDAVLRPAGLEELRQGCLDDRLEGRL